MKTSTVLTFAAFTASAVSAKSSKHSSKVATECSDRSKSWIIVGDGLSDFNKLRNAGGNKIAFMADSQSLAEAGRVIDKMGSRAVVWNLSEDELKAAHKARHESKGLKSAVKKLLSYYKSKTGEKARFVIVPKKTSKSIVKAFKKRKVAVIRASRKATSDKRTKKLIKKAKKHSKEGKSLPGGIVLFGVKEKNGAKGLKKLSKALDLVKGKKCLKSRGKKSPETVESAVESEESIQYQVDSSDENSGEDTFIPNFASEQSGESEDVEATTEKDSAVSSANETEDAQSSFIQEESASESESENTENVALTAALIEVEEVAAPVAQDAQVDANESKNVASTAAVIEVEEVAAPVAQEAQQDLVSENTENVASTASVSEVEEVAAPVSQDVQEDSSESKNVASTASVSEVEEVAAPVAQDAQQESASENNVNTGNVLAETAEAAAPIIQNAQEEIKEKEVESSQPNSVKIAAIEETAESQQLHATEADKTNVEV